MSTEQFKVGDFVELLSNFTPKRYGYIQALLPGDLAIVRESGDRFVETHRKLVNLRKPT